MVNEEKLMARLKERGVDAKIVDVEKNNGIIFHGVSIQAGNVCPTLYFANYKDEDEMLEACMKSMAMETKLDLTIDQFKDYEQIKNRLTIRLSGHPRSVLACKKAFCDLYSTVHVKVGENAYFGVTETMLDIWKISEDELFRDALKNIKTLEPAIFVPLGDYIRNLTKGENDDEVLNLYLLSNISYFYGASAALYAYLPDDFIAFPSSVHELIIMYPIIYGADLEELAEMVREINSEYVNPEDVLSNHVYRCRKGEWKVIA